MKAPSPRRLALATGACAGVVLLALGALGAVGRSPFATPFALLLLGSLGLLASLSVPWAVAMRRAGLGRLRAAHPGATAGAALVAVPIGAIFWLELEPTGGEAFPTLGPLWLVLVAAASFATGLAAGTAFAGVERALEPHAVTAVGALATATGGAGRRVRKLARTRWLAPCIALAVFLLLAAYDRDLHTPINRDAGQYLYVGSVILDGGLPYVDAANNKGPVTYLLFAVIALVADGSSVLVRASLIPFTALASLALAAYVSRFAGRGAGLAAGVALAFLAGPEVMGDDAPNTEHYALAGMAGALWLATRRTPLSAVLAGCLTTLTLLMNLWFLFMVPFVAFELWRARDPGSTAPARFVGALGGGVAVSALVLGWVGLEGALDEMVAQLTDAAGASVGPNRTLKSDVLSESLPFYLDLPYLPAWVLGVGGSLIAVSDRRLRGPALVALLWVLAIWVRARFSSYSYEHHFLPAAVGLSTGIGLFVAWSVRHRSIATLALAAALIVLTAASGQVPDISRDRDRGDRPARLPGELAVPVASFVRTHTEEDDGLFVAGSVGSVYWLAERRSPTPFFDIYPLIQGPENRAVRDRDLNREPPTAVAFLPEYRAAPVPSYVRELFARHRYREAFRIDGARVWLKADPEASRSPPPATPRAWPTSPSATARRTRSPSRST